MRTEPINPDECVAAWREDLEADARMGIMRDDSPGGTSRRCEPAPGISYFKGFSPKSDLPKALYLQELALLLRDKGLEGNFDDILLQLSKVSYSHLKPYCRLFLGKDGRFRPGTTIRDVIGACNFDRCFQSDLLRYIGIIEVRLRNAVSYHLALRYGPFSHLDPSVFRNLGEMGRVVELYRAERDRKITQGNVDVKRLDDEYGDLPVWAAVEVMSLGTLSRLFRNIRYGSVRKAICGSFRISPKVMQGWLRTLSFVRNECAHFGVMYGMRFTKESPRVHGFGEYDNHVPFHACAIIQYLLSTGEATYAQAFPKDLAREFSTFSIDPSDLGFPEGWAKMMIGTAAPPRGLEFRFRPGEEASFHVVDTRLCI